jgi:hypothetical protein
LLVLVLPWNMMLVLPTVAVATAEVIMNATLVKHLI